MDDGEIIGALHSACHVRSDNEQTDTFVISLLERLSPLCLSLVVPSDGHAYLAPLTAEEQKSSAAIASWCSRYAALGGKAC